MGECLAELMERVVDVLFEDAFTGQASQKESNIKWVVQSSFWLLCGKILQDKQVDKFKKINPQDVDQIIQRVNKHYGCESNLEFTTKTKQQKCALQKAASIVFKHPPLSNITTESFSYIYEKVFVTPKIRQAFGVHATPSYLVDYIVWQLWPWIKNISQDQRMVFEPTCGHAPFLTSAMRLLRELYDGDENNLHDYLKKHLVGIEKDPFAKEIARLSLTIADVPNPNGWDLIEKDAFEDETLSEVAKKSTILLCNPPFENYSQEENEHYPSLKCHNKAAEVLWRILPHMPDNSVFGVILPQGFLHAPKKNIIELRKYLLMNCEIREIMTLPENVFKHAKHKSTVIVGRKKKKVNLDEKVLFHRIERSELSSFAERYAATTEIYSQSDIAKRSQYNMKLRILEDVWEYCENITP